MSRERDRDSDSIPVEVGADDTGVYLTNPRVATADKIGRLAERLKAIKENIPTWNDVRKEVTGARDSIKASIVEGDKAIETNMKERLDGIKEEMDKHVGLEAFEALKVDVEKNKLPAGWKLVAAVFTVVLTVGGVIMNAQQRVNDLATQAAILQLKVSTLESNIAKLQTDQSANASKLDQLLAQLLTHGGRP